MNELKINIKNSIKIERDKTNTEGISNYKVNFQDGRVLEIFFDGFVKSEYSSFPSFKIYLNKKLLDFEDNGNSLYLFTRDNHFKSNK